MLASVGSPRGPRRSHPVRATYVSGWHAGEDGGGKTYVDIGHVPRAATVFANDRNGSRGGGGSNASATKARAAVGCRFGCQCGRGRVLTTTYTPFVGRKMKEWMLTRTSQGRREGLRGICAESPRPLVQPIDSITQGETPS